MAKENIGGEIESTPLNNNFADSDSEISSLKSRVSDVETNKANKSEVVIPSYLLASNIINDTVGVSGYAVSNALLGLKNRIDNIIASSGTSDTEVVDSRYDAVFDILYTVLENRLNAMSQREADNQSAINNIVNQLPEELGLRWNQTTDTYERLGLAKGKTYSKSGGIVTSDFDNIYPWSDMRRCNLADNLDVNAYYGDAGYIEDGSNGQVMVEIPQFWIKTNVYTDTDGDKIFEWYVSEYPRGGYKLHPMFINTNQNLIYTKVYMSAYEGTLYDNSAANYVGDGVTYDTANDIMASVANLQPISGNSSTLNIGVARTLAENRGVSWTQQDWTTLSGLQLLYLVEFADFNSQSVLSYGILNLDSGTGNHSQNTGHTSILGNKSGEVEITSLENGATGATSTFAMSYRGVENFYGNIWKITDGILLRDDGVYVQDDISDFNDTHTNYKHIPFDILTSSGYISDVLSKEDFDYCFFPLSSSGSSSTRLSDYYYAYNGVGAIRILQSGGAWHESAFGGAFAASGRSSVATSYRILGARLLAKKEI